MNDTVNRALPLWGFGGAKYHLIAARENAVFQVTHQGTLYALRLHRVGYRTDAELRSELIWMDAAAQGGIIVPSPVKAADGAFLQIVNDVQVDVLTWLEGQPMSTPGGPLTITDRPGSFYRLGREMARFHQVCDAWTPPRDFTRCAWDRRGLLGETPLWDRFWENPGLSNEDQDLLLALRAKANADLANLESGLDFGLIHADMVNANVMVHGDQIALIDFDDGGYGFRLFEIATALLKQKSQPDYQAMHDALIKGYLSVQSICLDALDLFFALRAVTYVGWNISRMNEDGAEGRNERVIEVARQQALAYIG